MIMVSLQPPVATNAKNVRPYGETGAPLAPVIPPASTTRAKRQSTTDVLMEHRPVRYTSRSHKPPQRPWPFFRCIRPVAPQRPCRTVPQMPPTCCSTHPVPHTVHCSVARARACMCACRGGGARAQQVLACMAGRARTHCMRAQAVSYEFR